MQDGLKAELESYGYTQLKEIPGRGICAIMRFMFTTAIVYGLDSNGYKGRYCYDHKDIKFLVLAYETWDGKEDPIGPWIKHKGDVEYHNPTLPKESWE